MDPILIGLLIFFYVLIAAISVWTITILDDNKTIEIETEGVAFSLFVACIFWPASIILVPLGYLIYLIAKFASAKLAKAIEWGIKEVKNPRENV